MVKLRPLLKESKLKQGTIFQKIWILLSHLEMEGTKNMDDLALLKQSEDWRQIGQRESIEFWKKLEQELVAEHLLALVKSEGQAGIKFVVTDSGRRFLSEFQRKQKMEK